MRRGNAVVSKVALAIYTHTRTQFYQSQHLLQVSCIQCHLSFEKDTRS
jgi:hypothetical protein